MGTRDQAGAATARQKAAADTKKRERAEFLKWNREIREEQVRRENQRWRGKKNSKD